MKTEDNKTSISKDDEKIVVLEHKGFPVPMRGIEVPLWKRMSFAEREANVNRLKSLIKSGELEIFENPSTGERGLRPTLKHIENEEKRDKKNKATTELRVVKSVKKK